MKKCIHKTGIAEWMSKGKTTVIQKDPDKGTAPNNYIVPTDDTENTNRITGRVSTTH